MEVLRDFCTRETFLRSGPRPTRFRYWYDISFENEYISLSGDDTTLGGRETVRILRGASFSDNSMEFKHNDLNGLLVVSHSGRL
jgi:hypothetical protein